MEVNQEQRGEEHSKEKRYFMKYLGEEKSRPVQELVVFQYEQSLVWKGTGQVLGHEKEQEPEAFDFSSGFKTTF